MDGREGAPMDKPGELSHLSGYARRGWWDYVPESPRNSGVNAEQASLKQESASVLHALRHRLWELWRPAVDPPEYATHRKPSLPGEHPIPQPQVRPVRASMVSGSHRQSERYSSSRPYDFPKPRPTSPAPSSVFNKLTKLVLPRMILFQEVLKNEVRVIATLHAMPLLTYRYSSSTPRR